MLSSIKSRLFGVNKDEQHIKQLSDELKSIKTQLDLVKCTNNHMQKMNQNLHYEIKELKENIDACLRYFPFIEIEKTKIPLEETKKKRKKRVEQ